jgi:hypothetical protein
MKIRHILLVIGLLVVIAVITITVMGVVIFKAICEEEANIKEKLTLIHAEREFAFLEKLQEVLAENEAEEAILAKEMSLSRIVQIKNSKPSTSLEGYEHNRKKNMSEEMQFLINIQNILSSNTKCTYAEQMISQHIVDLRVRNLSFICADTRKTACFVSELDEVPSDIYIPANIPLHKTTKTESKLLKETDPVSAIQQLMILAGPQLTVCSDKSVIKYILPKDYSTDTFLREVIDFYASSGWQPLKHDLEQPDELGGIDGGWREGSDDLRFWTQHWKNATDEIVNVNVYTFKQMGSHVDIIHSTQKVQDWK